MQKKIQLRPYEILNQILLGFIEIQTGNYTESISTFSEVLNRDSTNIKALSYRAFARYRAKQYAKAIADCDTFFRYNPEDISRTMNGNLLDMSAASAVAGIQTLTHSQMYPLRALSRRKLGDKSWHSDIRKALLLGQTNEQVRELIDTAEKAEAIFYDITKERVLFPQAWQFPEHYQLYARDHNDSARVPLQGIILRLGYDSVYVRTYKNGALLHRSAQILAYNASSQATFSLQTSIHAEKSIYRFEVGVKNKTQDTILAMRDSILCGDAFMMNGQSNVVYGSAWKPQENQYFRTFSLNIDDHFWNIPPSENNTLANALMENIVKVSSVPVAIINGGLGGTKIETHLPRTLHSEPSSLYGRLNTYATAANLAKTAKAMIWYQGEANTADDYGQKFDTLRTAWKQDYPSINKVYVVQIRPSECGQATQDALREIQRNFGTKYPDVEVIAASGLPAHDGCHYRNDGYITLGKQLFNLINRDFYKATDTLGISSPNLVKAAWTGAKRDEIALTFASNDALVCGSDTSVAGKVRTLANDAFLLDGKPAKAVSVRSEKNVVLVKLSSASGAKTISYIPEKCYVASGDVPCVVYEGPWITTSRGVGALTFANVTIQAIP
jgi:tetratricopeptide (TPR) repeat protein